MFILIINQRSGRWRADRVHPNNNKPEVREMEGRSCSGIHVKEEKGGKEEKEEKRQ